MAFLLQPKDQTEVKTIPVAKLRQEYNKLAEVYNKIVDLDYIYCPCCGEFLTRTSFYTTNDSPSGILHIGCKKCLTQMATDYDKKTNTYTDNKEKTIQTLKKMNLPFIESVYNSAKETVANNIGEKNRGTAWKQYIVMIRSLPQYSSLHWSDSETYEDMEDMSTKKVKEKTKKFFGQGFSTADYLFLEEQYNDWTTRHECATKAQEEIFKQICFVQLDIYKAKLKGAPTKDLMKTLQDLLDTANLKPKQNNLEALSEAQTMGTLLAKYEETRPLPEIDEELDDVDHIGQNIEIFFKGHLAKMLNLNNPLSRIYEHFMEKYAAKKPEYGEDTDSEVLFEKIFGKDKDEEE